MFGVDGHTTLILNIPFKIQIFHRIGKKNKQTSVSNADQEIPTLRSTDNVGNLVNLVSPIILYPQVGLSLSASETEDRFYLSYCQIITV